MIGIENQPFLVLYLSGWTHRARHCFYFIMLAQDKCSEGMLGNSKKETFTFELAEEMRLDKALVHQFPASSRTYLQMLIDQNCMRVNGKSVKKRTRVRQGDCVEVTWLKRPLPSLEPEALPLDILFEDRDLLCINKPAGLVVHPAPGHEKHTFVNALLHHVTTLPCAEGDLRPGIVHRLDKETSGVLIAAKTSVAQRRLVELFSKRQVEKEYLAICLGSPGETVVETFIGRDHKHRQKMGVYEDRGKKAVTEIATLLPGHQTSFVRAHPITGRTHQIRVHLRHLGCPILGDNVYGAAKLNEKWQVPRHMLHAHRLALPHPISGSKLEIEAPLADDFRHYLEQFFDSAALSYAMDRVSSKRGK